MTIECKWYIYDFFLKKWQEIYVIAGITTNQLQIQTGVIRLKK